MAAELEPITNPRALTERVLEIKGAKESKIIVSDLGSGVIRFSEAVFPELDVDKILVQSNDREEEGRGPHFDVYQNFINEDYPWIAIYNLSGFAIMTAMDLPEDLASSYLTRYPDPTDTAFDARRLFSAIALDSPGAEPTKGYIRPGIGVVISQGPNGPHVIHDIVPEDKENPGKYLKFVAPADTKAAKQRMREGGYETLDELITKNIGGTILDKEAATDTGSSGVPQAGASARTRTIARPIIRPPSHRRCNLD